MGSSRGGGTQRKRSSIFNAKIGGGGIVKETEHNRTGKLHFNHNMIYTHFSAIFDDRAFKHEQFAVQDCKLQSLFFLVIFEHLYVYLSQFAENRYNADYPQLFPLVAIKKDFFFFYCCESVVTLVNDFLKMKFVKYSQKFIIHCSKHNNIIHRI